MIYLDTIHEQIPTRPHIRVWWRHDAPVPTEERPTDDERTILFEGMKIFFSSGLCDNITSYMSDDIKMLQPTFSLEQIGDDDMYNNVMKKRESKLIANSMQLIGA